MGYSPILPAEIASGSAIDTLLLTKIKDNFDHIYANQQMRKQPNWNHDLANAAQRVTEYNEEVYKFQYGLAQAVTSTFRVPDTYTVGTKLSMKIGTYSPSTDNTKTNKFQAKAILIRSTDPITSIGNQQTFTSEITNTSTANDHETIEIDLSDASGGINGIGIQPGDVIKIELSRGSDTDTETIRFIPNLTEIKVL